MMRNAVKLLLMMLTMTGMVYLQGCGREAPAYESGNKKGAGEGEGQGSDPANDPAWPGQGDALPGNTLPDRDGQTDLPPKPPTGPGAPVDQPDSPVSDDQVISGPATENCLKGSGDFFGKGPYTVKRGKGISGFSIWEPSGLGDGCPRPIVSWGNGTGVNGEQMTFWSYGHYADHLASWGFVVIYSHADGGAGNSGGAPLGKGIDHIISTYGDDVSGRAGTFGHSQGGKAALDLGRSHDAVEAIVSLQGYGGVSGKPTMFLTGQNDVQLAATGKRMYQSHQGTAYLAELAGADHISSPTFPSAATHGKKYGGAAVAMFRCHLADDQRACDWLMSGSKLFCKGGGWSQCEGKE